MAAKHLDKTTEKFVADLEAQKGPPLYKMSVKDAREVLNKVQANPGTMPTVLIEDDKILCENQEVYVRFVRPAQSVGVLPVIMYFHGGGWILGNKETHDRLIREIAHRANACVVFVNYSPSPEAHYPKPIEEAYAATKYIAENAHAMDLDASRLVVMGDSVGGNMAAAVTLLAKERKGPKISHQFLFYPVTDASFDTPSYKEFANGPWLTKAAMEWFWNAYAPKVADRKKPTASPLQASLDQLKDLPAALVITDENDVLRDEGEAYAQKLKSAGVDVTHKRMNGTIHDFLMLNALKDTQPAREALELAVTTLKKVLAEPKAMKKRKAA